MSWMEDISTAIKYIEENICEDITVDDIAKQVNLSPFYFQKGFAIICGFTVAEYIRNRRLSLAGRDLQSGKYKVIDVAFKYGYDSPDSFTKAFYRFHGVTPVSLKSPDIQLNYFLPLRMTLEMKGGFEMEFKVVKKPAFTVVGYKKDIPYDAGDKECPAFWDEHFQSGREKYICGMYGLCVDENIMQGKFDYYICDDYVPSKTYPAECTTVVIPEHTWAIFKCVGAMPDSLQEINTKIFKDWLPNNPDYEIAGGYNIELYTDATKYPKGTQDENYYSEIWLPIKQK